MFRQLISWLNPTRTRKAIRRTRRRPTCKPCVDILEDRAMPTGSTASTVFTVNTLADTIDNNPNVTSLREAVRAANARSGADEVIFADNLNGPIILTSGRIRIKSPLTITAPDLNEVTVIGLNSKAFSIDPRAGTVNIDEDLAVMDGRKNPTNPRARPRLTSVTPVDATTLVLDFNTRLGTNAANPASYQIPGLTVERVLATPYPTRVVLSTSLQADVSYTVSLVNLLARDGRTVQVPDGAGGLTGIAAGEDTTPPRVVGAISLGNNQVLVSFSEAMSDSALNPAHYAITQANFNPEAGILTVLGGSTANSPSFQDDDRTAVVLTTSPQNELTYTVKVVNVTDLAGNPFAPPVLAGGQRITPDQANFTGQPPSGDQLIDSDGDGLTDNDELRGWLVTVIPANGVPQTRGVTSDPFNVDSDGDNFTDNVEAQLRLDPRDPDSDDDLLTDWQEYTEIFSDHLKGDSDGDGVDDGTEWLGVLSSPVFADTDGDQIPDGIEIPLGGPRNILVADLPRPEITVGSVNLQLDVRFTETNNRERRDLGTESFRTTLANASTAAVATQHTVNLEASIGGKIGTEDRAVTAIVESGATYGYTFNQTTQSANEIRFEYEKSLQTEKEVTQGFTSERNVVGAAMQVAVNLNNLSDLAYRVKNLQITALILDPLDHSRLTPVATLVPEDEPLDGFTLGPLVANRGPVIFSNTTIIPSTVEDLMANSTGLIFRISNYDIVDESDRNFAFASQEVVERTGAVLIDFGGAGKLLAEVNGEEFDEINPPLQAEIHRVAVASGRVIDTNEDGMIDDRDHRVTFDLAGKQVGITLHSALKFIGLARYDETVTPTSSLSEEQLSNSYSTIRVGNLERIYRIRDIANDAVSDRFWEIIGPLGILRDVNLDTQILNAGQTISLNYVQDLDQDGLPADVEFFLRTSDSPEPAGTAVPDATDTIGERVRFLTNPNFATGTLVHVSATGGGLTANSHYYIRNSGNGVYSFYSSRADAIAGTTAGRINLTGNITAVVGVPSGRDTDEDGLDDRFEALIGWTVTTPQRTYQVYSSPSRADSNFDRPVAGVDSDNDGREDRLEYNGSDGNAAPNGWTDRNGDGLRDRSEVSQLSTTDLVLDPIRKDTDQDGISDATEIIGFAITRITDNSTIVRSTNPNTPDTDGDTFSDGFERLVGLDPTNSSDTDEDGDGLPDPVETRGWAVRTFAVSKTPYQQGSLSIATRTSRTNSVDSDEDGLTDYDEFFLKTNPSSKDTDNDGIEDRLEALGFELGHEVGDDNLGIIKTNPLDADTDNDKRSDGAEAELTDVEQSRWVVRVSGQDPKQVFSNPLVADADFDRVVDGDEFAFGRNPTYQTDPNIGNTDGDARDDGQEFSGGTNPLIEDFQVTVFFTGLKIDVDGDGMAFDPFDPNPGDFGFDLGIRKPDSSQPVGLSSQFTSVLQANVEYTSYLTSRLFGGVSAIEAALPDWDGFNQQSLRDNGDAVYGINIGGGFTLNFPGLVPESVRSVSFGMTRNDFFSIEGVIVEKDDISGAGDTYVYLGGLEGVGAQEGMGTRMRPVFHGSDLLAAPSRFHDLTFNFVGTDNITTGLGGLIAGSLKMFFVVS